ncbi:hypothetical protein PRIPAC_88814 [Pristionchus pacificus]|uniref:Uncharacterized protein n=1 Tax=Pristionchus pacificus TaxID=54126 RepID=A0A2A6B8V7_PRIPA|nr:hypothetical protein PRIPAC_88814 [Pristionchus pacificus]|eukprot:PDM62305.1 hypothetical protein PRIPAC_51747 [Pristionchus pacificus]
MIWIKVDDASLSGPVAMQPPAAVTLSEDVQLPSTPILSQGLQRALARSAPRPISDEDNQQRKVALQNKVFPGTHLLPQEVAPAMRLGKPIPPPLKKAKIEEKETEKENEMQNTWKITAKMNRVFEPTTSRSQFNSSTNRLYSCLPHLRSRTMNGASGQIPT